MASGSQGGEPPVRSSNALHRQIQVLLTLHDGEHSFGMSLAQKSPAFGAKYTVVSSVFANSPADRAGVRKGYVVRCINDEPMGGLTVAQVANHFRNVGQARITLEVVESAVSPAFTAAGGVTTLAKRSTTQAEATARTEPRPTTPVTGFSAVSSGRAIAAPGSALAVPRVAAPKQPVLRLGRKPAAKTLGLQPQVGVIPPASASVTNPAAVSAAMASADAKTASGVSHTGLQSKTVGPVLRLGPKPKSVQPEKAAEKSVAVMNAKIDSKTAAKSVPEKTCSVPATVKHSTSSRIPQSPVQAIDPPRNVASVQVAQEHEKSALAAQPKNSPDSGISAKAVACVLSPPRATPAPAAKATAPISTAPSSVAAKKSVSAPGSRPMEAKPAATRTPTGNATLQPPSLPSTAAKSSSTVSTSATQRITTTGGKTQVSMASAVSTVNSGTGPARNSSSAPAIPAPKPTAAQRKSATLVPAEPAEVSTRRRTPPPTAVVAPRPKPEPERSTIPTPVRSSSGETTAARSEPASASPVTIPAPTVTKTGKKRGRPRKNATTNGTTSNKGKGKAKKAAKQQQESNGVDAVVNDDSDLEESPSKKATRRTANGRRRGVTERTRHSLTIDRLVGMGFTKEDAEASVKEIGDDPDTCMIWIISKIEERQFNEDLNRASIQSEQSKHDEEKRVKEVEKEKLAHAEKFMAIFPTSYMVCPESTASHLKKFLQSTIDRVGGEAYLREVLSELLKLEGKSIGWYKEAARSYMLELAGRLDAALGTHDIMTCCAHVSASHVSSPNGSCTFVRKVLEEVKALTMALFEMPTNQGGVPQVFLECDETTKFDLEDDGFEVIERNE